jgi:hypothetical protein
MDPINIVEQLKRTIMQKGNTAKMKETGKPGQQGSEQDQQELTNKLEDQQDNAGVEDDGSPVLDEEDLEENHITEEEADNIEWDEDENEAGGKQNSGKGNDKTGMDI